MKQHPYRTDLWVDEQGNVFRKLTASPAEHGYRTIKIGWGETVRRHTIVCEAYHGIAPPGHGACHKNGKHGDDRPGNLYWGTQAQNMADAVAHGTTTKGEKNAQSKLSEAQAGEIKKRRAAGESGKSLALEFKVSMSTVCDIHRGRTWEWL